MGLEIAVVMDFRRRDRVLREKFTSLEAIVYPMVKPEDGCMPVFQIFDMYSVRKAETEMEQWRIIFSDAKYYIEAVLAPELTENARSEQFKNGSIVRIVEFELYEYLHYEFRKRIIKVIQLEVLLRNSRVIGNEPMCLNLEDWREEDWEEGNSIWIDPDEQAYEEEGFWEEPCGFRDLTEGITPHAVRDINTNRNADLHPIILQIKRVFSREPSDREVPGGSLGWRAPTTSRSGAPSERKSERQRGCERLHCVSLGVQNPNGAR